MATIRKINDQSVKEKINQLDLQNGIAGRTILAKDTKEGVQNYLGIGRKNLIINGDMRIAQRGTTGTTPTSGYGQYVSVDRWATYYVNSTLTQTGVVVDNKKVKAVRNTAGGRIYLYQKIEAAGGLLGGGQPFSVSFWARSSVPWKHAMEFRWYDAGTLNGNGVSKDYQSLVHTDTEWKYFKFEGIRHPDNSANWAPDRDLFFLLSGGADSNATNIWLEVTMVQIELGETCTPFEHRHYGEELALCQRYYYEHAMSDNYNVTGNQWSTTQCDGRMNFPVTMQHTPSISFPQVDVYLESGAGGNGWSTNVTANVNRSSKFGTGIRCNHSGNVGTAVQVQFAIKADAEI